MLSIGFIGAGAVGSALSTVLSSSGYPVVAIGSRTFESAGSLAGKLGGGTRACNRLQEVADLADLVFLTVPDDAIAGVAASLRWKPGQAVLHCSGASPLSLLESARTQGALTGSFHPLNTFVPQRDTALVLKESTIAIESSHEQLLATLKQLASVVGAGWVVVAGEKNRVLYHVAAVMACNYVMALFKVAVDLWEEFGMSSDEATSALLPLLMNTCRNIEAVGLPGCLTGPIARGDESTVARHITTLATRDRRFLDVYSVLGMEAVDVALEKGTISYEIAERLRQELREARYRHEDGS